jgi:hypothetical protein
MASASSRLGRVLAAPGPTDGRPSGRRQRETRESQSMLRPHERIGFMVLDYLSFEIVRESGSLQTGLQSTVPGTGWNRFGKRRKRLTENSLLAA